MRKRMSVYLTNEQYYKSCKEHLETITKGLDEVCIAAGRGHVERNQLLRECYNLLDAELHTEGEWHKRGREIRHGQYAYLFWGEKTNVVRFLFCKEQTIIINK